MSSSKPTNKVIAGVMAGAVVTIAVWAAKQVALDVPIEVQGALTVLVTAAVQYVVRDADDPPAGDES
jgi:hypothetical protein